MDACAARNAILHHWDECITISDIWCWSVRPATLMMMSKIEHPENDSDYDSEAVINDVNISMTCIYQSALVVRWQKLGIKWWKGQNPADHALTSRSCLFLLQIFELAPIEGGGLIIAVVATIHVTIQVIVGRVVDWHIMQSTQRYVYCIHTNRQAQRWVKIGQVYTLKATSLSHSSHWTVTQRVRHLIWEQVDYKSICVHSYSHIRKIPWLLKMYNTTPIHFLTKNLILIPRGLCETIFKLEKWMVQVIFCPFTRLYLFW